MNVKFTHDFQGKITGNGRFYLEGTMLDVEDEIGQVLIAQGHAVVIFPEPVRDIEVEVVPEPLHPKGRKHVEST